MSSTATESAIPQTLDHPINHGPVQRIATYIFSRGKPLFAWLHRSTTERLLDHAVLICPPLGFEQTHSHRSLRHLADSLARQGIAALRFDWHGTGDSSGSDEEEGRLEHWTDNVRDMLDWLRQEQGYSQVSVVGVRMGALLAAEALRDNECENLVLWAPVTTGLSYMRQMQAIDLMAEVRPIPADAAPGDVEAAGYFMTESTHRELSQATFLQCQPRCTRALLVSPFDKRLPERLSSVGVDVDQITVPGYAEMMAEPQFAVVPRQAIEEITTWLYQHAQRVGEPTVQPRSAALNTAVEMPYPTQTATAAEGGLSIREHVWSIAGEVDLFGIVSEPVELSNALPTILIPNVGSSHRIGSGRLMVHLARHLAAQGFRCVRFDLHGLGDSIMADSTKENHPYPATTFRDVQQVLQQLKQAWGVERCVMLGLCSGAYATFQSTVQLDDPMLVEGVLINPLTYYWKDGMSIASTVARPVAQTVQAEPASAGLMSRLKSFFTRSKATASSLEQHTVTAPNSLPGHPRRDDLSSDLRRVVARGRKLALFIADSDPGYSLMTHHAPHETAAMLAAGQLDLIQIKQGDHTFSRRVPRYELIEQLGQYLRRRYQT